MTDDGNSDGKQGEARSRRILTDISPRAWEHPADRAALAALRKLPMFDTVLKVLFGIFGEKPIRLAFQANSVKVGPNQFPRVWELYKEVLVTMDLDEEYDLFITQTPIVNAGAYGMDKPFIMINSATKELLNDRELQYIIGHEVGHIVSGHVLYHTMMVLLIQLANLGFPLVGLAARAVLVALMEWARKSELSCDRAGLLTLQDPDVVLSAMLKMAGGGPWEAGETNVGQFIEQAEAYRESEDVADSVFKILNLMAATHPFWVIRVAEIRGWIESGDYDHILGGEYQRTTDPDPEYKSDLRKAAAAYKEGAKGLLDDVGGAAKNMASSLMDQFRK